MKSLISIIVPVYNVENFLKRCIVSIVEQTYQNIEIILVNDGSTDNSLNIIKDFQTKHSNIILINQKNKGLSGARNSGIQKAQGEYIIFVDSDDTIEKILIEDCLSYAYKNNSDIVVYGYTKRNEDMSIIAHSKLNNQSFSKHLAFSNLLRLDISPMACNKLIKTSLFQDNNILFPLSKLHEDVGTTYKLFWYTEKVSTLSQSYYNWINRDTSITSTISFKHINHIIELLLEKKHFLMEKNIFDTYSSDYYTGVLKLINLLLERSLHSSYSLLSYLHFILKDKVIIDIDTIKILNISDEKVITKFIKLYEESKNIINKDNINQHKDIEKIALENRRLKEKLISIENSTSYKLITKYYDFMDIILPRGSKRRKLYQKIRG